MLNAHGGCLLATSVVVFMTHTSAMCILTTSLLDGLNQIAIARISISLPYESTTITWIGEVLRFAATRGDDASYANQESDGCKNHSHPPYPSKGW